MDYSETLREYGPNDPRAVKWGTKQTQYFRFTILCDIADLTNATVVDLGCGLGDLYDYLLTQGFRGAYIGTDPNGDLLEAAKKKYPDARFQDILPKGDYVLMSGLFNEEIPNRDQEIKKTLTEAFTAASKGIAYNGICKAGGMATSDPAELFSWCVKNLTEFVTLRQDYRGGNFTLYLYRDKGVSF